MTTRNEVKCTLPKMHRWTNERDLHGPFIDGHNYKLTGSENSPSNGRFFSEALADKIVIFMSSLANFETSLVPSVRDEARAILEEMTK